MQDAARIYVASGAIRWACERAFWPLFFTRLVTDVQLSPLQLVLLGTVYEAGIFLGEIPTGVVADVYSRRLSVIISFLAGGSAFFMSALVSDYRWLIVSQVLVGVGWTFSSGAETAWITDELGSTERAEPLIIRRGRIQLVAAVIGIAIFATTAVLFSLTVAVALTGISMVAWGLVLIRVMPEQGFSRTDGEGWSEFASMLKNGLTHTAASAPLRILVVVVIVGGLAKEAIDRLDIQRLVDIGMPDDVDEAVIVGVLVAVRMLIAAVFLVIAERRVRGEQVVPALALFLFGVAVGIALLAHVELLWVAGLGLVIQGGFHNATEPLVTVWTNTFASEKARATVHSFVGQGESIGEVFGGIALGTTAEIFTVPIAMTVSLLLFVGAAIYTLSARVVWSTGPG